MSSLLTCCYLIECWVLAWCLLLFIAFGVTDVTFSHSY
uniref:Uncharacterized protein n=1 Tax=Rhizophora mucronata TaxID=61149 RepID=A0A2P2N487_RHIMU